MIGKVIGCQTLRGATVRIHDADLIPVFILKNLAGEYNPSNGVFGWNDWGWGQGGCGQAGWGNDGIGGNGLCGGNATGRDFLSWRFNYAAGRSCGVWRR